ncbi:MAG: hypothetical protein BroJett011_40730 [Chloroflexota bacterium]|nr:MAG: hypothetical protein BroJett011_40730 [Chloroflexota bacterium]
MATLRVMLEERRGNTPVEDWAQEINQYVDPEHRIRISTLYSYLNGSRNVTGKGARSLAQYFYKRGDMAMVNAISKITLGIPYPSLNGGQN